MREEMAYSCPMQLPAWLSPYSALRTEILRLRQQVLAKEQEVATLTVLLASTKAQITALQDIIKQYNSHHVFP
jgi:hypothetical protein